ncbi:MAG: 30S ribosomal protein S7 [Candidatus Doudnabacteria bacterium RIFCSPLOWO2_02_FULL_42_9]|uniref:Small ribosomal subunit protein uS7 n=1 Tax=Candidatus Doudnabacteria bacterium RIFCSPHIGHO2_01_FULL_41_86 TaxID=1817821 RepID=A0A1F5N973_9BACT|nr:MAG: 30S ribosomal protein S7 [Candidatus Doudnabacteria bacterium RIFCSPHIGHO2_01_FULL_41_86]OGE75003.1 MAG: 30S ribosomal protein S7 [Candidatus Doudnabacteria bacterium RIFCSPHIGHO2_01_43_10]OGE85290.1 MAG: 30S ribosomal protein S7 [Candidatus Doudnabacteria bacterium RIFCSPHIGHO2_12_FULL_42_22]OGE86828.1 MAG: 30S ribosomal protein S7 [Candidatus Doudnabacteria bacterium RIFCSPHIGHO2_02_FULL_42_25]OGE92427.1 MAG: 30S ribosomal protein S7 [Candidatus Doudnabacteria bacterium RIFCSPLOWO2_01
MPRKAKSYKKHPAAADYKYNSIKIGKFINYIMERGKKTVATKLVYGAFDQIEKEMKTDPKAVFEQAIRNVSPILEVKGRRIGGANYQVPMEVQEPRKTSLGMKWIIDAARNKKGKPMAFKLAAELMEAYNKLGAAIKKREDVHKMAEANKAFAHFARFQRR